MWVGNIKTNAAENLTGETGAQGEAGRRARQVPAASPEHRAPRERRSRWETRRPRTTPASPKATSSSTSPRLRRSSTPAPTARGFWSNPTALDTAAAGGSAHSSPPRPAPRGTAVVGWPHERRRTLGPGSEHDVRRRQPPVLGTQGVPGPGSRHHRQGDGQGCRRRGVGVVEFMLGAALVALPKSRATIGVILAAFFVGGLSRATSSSTLKHARRIRPRHRHEASGAPLLPACAGRVGVLVDPPALS